MFLFQRNNREFDVICSQSGRTYHLSDAGDVGAQAWIDFINAMIQKQNE